MTPGFHHEAVFYSEADEYLAGTLPDLRATLTAGGSVLAAVGDDKRQLLSGALGGDAEQVRFVDIERLGRNPACIIAAWREFVGDATAWDGTLPEPEATPVTLPFTRDDLLRVRAFVTERARHAGLAGERITDLVLAVNELVSNTIRHAGGRGVLRTWLESPTFFVEVADDGHIEDPLAGRERPPDADGGERGLWMANHLCDLVQLRSSPAGSVVRLHMSV